ncbi:hypothetical protein [Duganella aceris]|uniref:Uncharacterized protein n=1 Tax=Duganella aceris TaxID=2703883 RepID=A0ABX0FQA0_9BURK|nr:hypothetical protein [Duganella aceris]NGZ86705.1 hypothetical protein [Duganella aceris]
MSVTAHAKRRRAAARRSIVLANRRTLSHNRDEFKNSEQRQRASDAAALSDSEAGRAVRAAAMATSKKPRRHKARFDARIFRATRAASFRTRLSAHIANAASQASRWKRRAYVSWRA